jgi:hypothetical protein
MMVIRSDAPNAERTNIFLLCESPTFFQNCRGVATRDVSATMSAVQVEDHDSQTKQEGLTDQLRDRHRLRHLARVVDAGVDLLHKECGPHARKGCCNEIGDLSMHLGRVADSDDRENNAHARSPGLIS